LLIKVLRLTQQRGQAVLLQVAESDETEIPVAHPQRPQAVAICLSYRFALAFARKVDADVVLLQGDPHRRPFQKLAALCRIFQ
jgi:hypothetical protein